MKIRNTHLNCRRAWPPGETHRPIKRLFTPEIKRMLKDWLVRRRDNPYPSRDEKKTLANKTGLTYIQVYIFQSKLNCFCNSQINLMYIYRFVIGLLIGEEN